MGLKGNADAEVSGERAGQPLNWSGTWSFRAMSTSSPRYIPRHAAKKLVSKSKNNFDFLRLFFSVLVIFSHSYPLLHGDNDREPLMRLSGQMTLGSVSVDMFFIMSGYLIATSWNKSRNVRSFAMKRLRRIYPGLFMVNFLCFAILAPIVSPVHFGIFTPKSIAKFFLNTARLHGIGELPVFADLPWKGVVNGSLWSIPFEAWCYMGVVLLGVSLLIQKKTFVTAVFLASLVLSCFVNYRGITPNGLFLEGIIGPAEAWVRLLPYFLVGIVYSLHKNQIDKWPTHLIPAVGIIVLSCFVKAGLTLTLPTLGAYCLFAFANKPVKYLKDCAKKGDFSYGIYLYAFPIQQTLIHLYKGWNPLTLFTVAFVLSFGFGFLSWHFVERRFISGRNESVVPVSSALRVRESTIEAPVWISFEQKSRLS
jgi:peptidoglycan/LPS O-acetylase OafA/YrhL